ncbi:hypothetical protein C8N36_103163 [Pelagimonas varians]|uniref:Uncharacterized protein n=2 Tax=Pelagimonas varians TaxID=696760 RepID=A0A238KF17_9RHOB|nr:hypothetical protein C8N36_103163 [Pelagimonas varians]SMX41400.1 hypothetical protein PEV8663_02267 [Pelagimonas varians]
MAEHFKARHPVKVGGKLIGKGGGVDPAKIDPVRLARLQEKGRIGADDDPSLTNRAQAGGRPSAADVVKVASDD